MVKNFLVTEIHANYFLNTALSYFIIVLRFLSNDEGTLSSFVVKKILESINIKFQSNNLHTVLLLKTNL